MPGRVQKRGPELYERLLGAFREKPGNFSYAATRGRVNDKTAAVAWNTGWPELGEWAKPIKEALEEEGILIRAKLLDVEETSAALMRDPVIRERIRAQVLEEAHEAAVKVIEEKRRGEGQAREKATVDAQKTRQDEALVARSLRTRAAGLAANTTPLLEAFALLTPKVAGQLKRLAALPDVEFDERVKALDVLRLMTWTADYLNKAATIAQAAILIDRKASGDPDFVLSLKGKEMNYEEALKIMEGAKDAASRVAEFSVILGGKK